MVDVIIMHLHMYIVYVYIYIHIYVYVRNIYIYIYYIYIYMYVQRPGSSKSHPDRSSAAGSKRESHGIIEGTCVGGTFRAT